jgi:hypothetical protein
LRDVVRLLEEQLSIATCFESELKAVVPLKADAARHVIDTNLRLLANFLFIIM